jgi:hypothetical protein
VSEQRLTDAGTTNQWTFAGEGKVYVWPGGLPSVLGRPLHHADAVIAIKVNRPGGPVMLMISPHEAKALMEILPAAIAVAEQEDHE